MDVFKELKNEEFRKKAINELVEAQNKIINDCKERYCYYRIQLEKINILEGLINNIINNEDEKDRFNEEINNSLNEAKEAIDLRNKLQSLL